MLGIGTLIGVTCILTGPNFNETLAKILMGVNAATLCPDSRIIGWNCSRCSGSVFDSAPQVVTAGNGDLLAIVGQWPTENAVLLAIRGSKTPGDYIRDAEFWQVGWDPTPPGSPSSPWTGSRVHHGFAKAFDQLFPLVVPLLRSQFNREPSRRFIITGHSLGASIAALFAARLTVHPEDGIPPPAVMYTFGEPRTGNPRYALAFDSTVSLALQPWRVVNKCDIVPQIPPRFGKGNDTYYMHERTEVWLKPPDGVPEVCNGSGEDPTCSDSIPVYKWSPADHTSYFGLDAGPCSD